MKKVPGFVILSSLVILSGCASLFNNGSESSISAPLEPNAIARFTDIPVPAGFKLQSESSYAFENSGTRVAMLRYKGKADIQGISNFYKAQMATHSWHLLNSLEYGQCMMNFDREEETCVVNLSPKGSTVIITISLGPKSPNTVKKSEKTLK